MKYILLIIILLTACGDLREPVVEAPVEQPVNPMVQALINIRQDLMSNHLEPDMTDEEIVIALRTLIHNAVTLGAPSKVYDFTIPWERYTGSIRGDEPQSCGGQSYLYELCLAAMGIPARHVGLYNSTDAGYWSHATTEVYLNGEWFISDSTFNTGFISNTGDYLSWQEIRDGKEYGLTNTSLLWIWKIWEKAEITNHIIIYPYFTDIELVPKGWNGIVNGKNVIPTGPDMYSIIN